MRASRGFAALAIALFALASAGPAGAVSLVPVCADGCFGVDIELDVTLTSVQLTMHFQNYVGTSSFHPDLEAVACKLNTNDDVTWDPVPGNPFASFTDVRA